MLPAIRPKGKPLSLPLNNIAALFYAERTSSDQYAYSPGTSGNSFSTPDSTLNSITGDLTLVFSGSLDWQSASVQTLIAKDGISAGTRSYALNLQAGGYPRLNLSFDGSTVVSYTSVVANTLTAWSKGHIKVERNGTNGDIKFWQSTDKVNWTQLDGTVSGSSSPIYDGTAVLAFGYLSAGAYNLNGYIYDSEVYSGLMSQGTHVLKCDFDPWDWVQGSTWIAKDTGETWTINTSGTPAAAILGSNIALNSNAVSSWADQSGLGENLLTYSEQFDYAGWTKISTSVTANANSSPDQTVTADRITATAASAGHYIFQTAPTFASAMTGSVYVKYVNHPWVLLRLFDGTNSFFGSFNVQTGLAGAKSAAATTTITDAGNGWYRLTVSATTLAGVSGNLVIALNNSDSASILLWTAAGTEAIDVWGAQLNQGSTTKPYIQTTSSAQGSRNLVQATGANQPTYLSYEGTKYAWHPGVAGNYFSTPNAAANQITGDIDIRWYGELDNWNSASIQDLISKYINSGSGSFDFLLNNGTLAFQWRNLSGTPVSGGAPTLPLLTNGVAYGLRVALDVDDGNGNRVTTFYYSTDFTNWILFYTNTVSGTTSIFNSSLAVTVGIRSDGASYRLSGKTYRAQIYNGINGTLAVDFNPASWTSGSTWTSATGEVWTINNAASTPKPAQIVDKASLLFDGVAHYLKTAAFTLNQPTTVYIAFRSITYTSADRIFDGLTNNVMGLYQSGTNQYAWASGTPQTDAVAYPPNNNYVMACVFNGAASSFKVNYGNVTVANTGVLASDGISLATNGATSVFGNIQVYGFVIYSAAHDAATQTKVINFLKKKYNI